MWTAPFLLLRAPFPTSSVVRIVVALAGCATAAGIVGARRRRRRSDRVRQAAHDTVVTDDAIAFTFEGDGS